PAARGPPAAPGPDDRPAAQRGVVALLDRRVERVHVDVDDLAYRAHAPFSRHRRAFASAPALAGWQPSTGDPACRDATSRCSASSTSLTGSPSPTPSAALAR